MYNINLENYRRIIENNLAVVNIDKRNFLQSLK
jgi:hypothetical protein